MSYIENCFTHRQTIIDNFEEAKALKSVLSEKNVKDILMYCFNNTYNIKWQNTSRNLQPLVDIDMMVENVEGIKDLFNDLVGPFCEYHTGNYYITTMLHDPHCDLLTKEECSESVFKWAKNVIPFKSMIIPLAINSDAEAYTAFFRERHIGHSITLDKANWTSQENSMYEIAREYPDFYKFGKSYTGKEMWNPSIPQENAEDLEIESIIKFNVGDIMLFDACQIHMSVVDRNKQERDIDFLKTGLNIQFYREV